MVEKRQGFKIMIPVCFECKHFDRKHSFVPVFKCRAFKDRIPKLIVVGGNKHLQPLPEQKNKIVFEKKKEREE